jgi:5S rRNA maturation endonuclease (ribonuclease M5)
VRRRHHQLQAERRARYASTSGSFGERQGRHVAVAIARLPRGSTVVVATDSDLAGDKLAERIDLLAGDVPTVRHRAPLGKDWNECLQRHERDYIRSLGLRGQGRSR